MLLAQTRGAPNLLLPLRAFPIKCAMGDGEKESEGRPRGDKDLGGWGEGGGEGRGREEGGEGGLL